ncbi:hypothetical protein TNCT_8291 [Trichonephila clavata]|uniref:Secreted protein n=1 Tax=Trichonephila clavata TaxID=2740835 RepID=A0A8X6LFW4_TRICU|nr:hypothetical protein TNCT_8291 [Trichonephila clavata]
MVIRRFALIMSSIFPTLASEVAVRVRPALATKTLISWCPLRYVGCRPCASALLDLTPGSLFLEPALFLIGYELSVYSLAVPAVADPLYGGPLLASNSWSPFDYPIVL